MPGHGEIIIGDRRQPPDDRRKMDEPVTVKVLVGVLSTLIAVFVIWSVTIASSSVVSVPRFERDSARRDWRDTLQSRDMQDMRADVRCIRAVVKKSPTVDEVCR